MPVVKICALTSELDSPFVRGGATHGFAGAGRVQPEGGAEARETAIAKGKLLNALRVARTERIVAGKADAFDCLSEVQVPCGCRADRSEQ